MRLHVFNCIMSNFNNFPMLSVAFTFAHCAYQMRILCRDGRTGVSVRDMTKPDCGITYRTLIAQMLRSSIGEHSTGFPISSIDALQQSCYCSVVLLVKIDAQSQGFYYLLFYK